MSADGPRPLVTFALGMMSVEGSPPFPALVFDDGAAVSLHALRGLAGELGAPLPDASLGEMLGQWAPCLHALVGLVQVLAYDDRARGHRGRLVEEAVFEPARLLPDARQTFRIGDGEAVCLPATVQAAAVTSLALDGTMRQARPNLCLAAIMGRICRDAPLDEAREAVAGWSLAVELVQRDASGLVRLSRPGSVMLGPLLVPRAFAGDLDGIGWQLSMMGRTVATGDLGKLAVAAAERISVLSRDVLLLPGDVVLLAAEPLADIAAAEQVDIIEAYAPGFGRQKISLQ